MDPPIGHTAKRHVSSILVSSMLMLAIAPLSWAGDKEDVAAAVGEILYGILRAGLVTAMVISLTLLALEVADGISAAIVAHMPKQFFQSLASAWGAKGWGGLGASALAFVAALVEVPDDDRATLALIQRVAITEVGGELRQAYVALATRVVEAAASRSGGAWS